MKKIILLFCPVFLAISAWAQTHTEKITREFSFEKKSADNALIIANINGDIKVVAYEGEKILVEVNKTIRAKTEARLEKGKQEVKLGVMDRADTLILYSEGNCNDFGRVKEGHNDWPGTNWGYNWSNCNGGNCKQEYDYTLDFTVKVPVTLNVLVSTINDGNIEVEGVKGAVRASNINGSIKLTNLARETWASTINGDVDVTYSLNPAKDCRYYSLNGDINAVFQKNLSANFSFESFNGDLYSDISPIESLPAKVEKSDRGEGISYKVNGNRYKIRSGGIHLDFETFNGDVYLKEKSN